MTAAAIETFAGDSVGVRRRGITIELARVPDGCVVLLTLPKRAIQPRADYAIVRLFYREDLPDLGVVTLSKLDAIPVCEALTTTETFPIPFERVAFVRVTLVKQIGEEEMRLDDRARAG